MFHAGKDHVSAMNFRMVKKVISGSVINILVIFSSICFVLLFLQGFYTIQILNKCNKDIVGTSLTSVYHRMPSSTEKTVNITLNPLMLRKLAQIKKALNDSFLKNETIFPARRIGGYLLLNPNLCNDVERVDIVIIVHTALPNLERRQRIRDSFALGPLFRPFQIRVAFLLGKTHNRTLEKILWIEHATYNDTVMGDFTDDYHNLSLKGIMGYRWVSQYCSNSQFVLKIDDDVLINMFKLLYSFLSHMNGKKRSLFCNVWFNGTMPILREGKWKVDSHIFASQEKFPYDYCSGFVVIMTSDLMEPLYQAAMTTPFFWIDDVYLFGMLPSVVGGVTYYNYALDRNMTLNETYAIKCTHSLGARCPIFATLITDQAYWLYWDLIKGIYSFSDWTVENKKVQ